MTGTDLEVQILQHQLNTRETELTLLRGAVVKLAITQHGLDDMVSCPDMVADTMAEACHKASCTLNTLEVQALKRTLVGGV